jgi:hypothetical protein
VISVDEVIQDPDMVAPEPFYVLRSTGSFVLGGFQSTTTSIPCFGPIHVASDREINMLPEADRVGAVRSFWTNIPLYTTRGTAPVPSVHGEVPIGSGTEFTLTTTPPGLSCTVYDGAGKQLTDFTVAGAQLVFTTAPTAPLYATWPITVQTGQSASDIIQYGAEQYRVSHIYRVPGSGFWRALAVRMDAA